MALRLSREIVRGEIDNTTRGKVVGEIWLAGRDESLRLKLDGNCWRDLAGCICTFENPHPVADPDRDPFTEQIGEVGDMTASRKVRIPDGPVDEWHLRRKKGLDAPEHTGNALYLEWFSERNGRVVIETTEFTVSISLPVWTLTKEEEQAQQARNAGAMTRFLQKIEEALQPRNPVEVPEHREMDEFEWERFMKESDARSERFGEALEKYADHPEGEALIDKAMGWDQPSEGPGFEIPDDLEPEAEEREPDPAREGIDWVRNKHGDVVHPLQHRCYELGMRMHFDIERVFGGRAENGDAHEMAFKVQCASAKLAGSLNAVMDEYAPEPGFTIAYLKRALALLNEGLAAFQRLVEQDLMPDERPAYREELFGIRDHILRLMDAYRGG
jgi:hypothetical protein